MRTCLAVALVIAGAAGVSFGAPRARVRQPPAVEERVPARAPRAPALPSSGAASPASPVAPAGPIQ